MSAELGGKVRSGSGPEWAMPIPVAFHKVRFQGMAKHRLTFSKKRFAAFQDVVHKTAQTICGVDDVKLSVRENDGTVSCSFRMSSAAVCTAGGVVLNEIPERADSALLGFRFRGVIFRDSAFMDVVCTSVQLPPEKQPLSAQPPPEENPPPYTPK